LKEKKQEDESLGGIKSRRVMFRILKIELLKKRGDVRDEDQTGLKQDENVNEESDSMTSMLQRRELDRRVYSNEKEEEQGAVFVFVEKVDSSDRMTSVS
jgi:hypothetical protein